MTRSIAKLFAAAAIALSLLLVIDSVRGLTQAHQRVDANLAALNR